MSCRGCPEKNKNLKFDRYGNPIVEGEEPKQEVVNTPTAKDSAMGEYEKEIYEQATLKTRNNITYKDYVREKNHHKDKTRTISEAVIKNFSDDYKRIQVDELISVFNNEEVHRLSPTQALVMLHELVHHKDYQKIIAEFTNLPEQVDKKYKELMSNNIIINWSPK